MDGWGGEEWDEWDPMGRWQMAGLRTTRPRTTEKRQNTSPEPPQSGEGTSVVGRAIFTHPSGMKTKRSHPNSGSFGIPRLACLSDASNHSN